MPSLRTCDAAIERQAIRELLAEHRLDTLRRHHFGLPAKPLDPLSNQQARIAEEELVSLLFSGYFPCADRKVERTVTAKVSDAVQCANLAWQMENRKPMRSRAVCARLMERDGPNCWVCDHPLHDNISIEHKVAQANGGTHDLANLALAHTECNRSLGRLPVEAKEAARKAIQERNAA